MIRLYNHTRYDDAAVRAVFTFAARVLKIKGDVPVKVTHTRHRLQCHGWAHKSYPYRKTLIGKPTTSRDKRLLRCPIGWIGMALPRHLTWWDKNAPADAVKATEAAEWFVDVAIHEMAHIRQFRTPGWDGRVGFRSMERRREDGSRMRRQRHDDRPCEIDAENAVYDVRHNYAQNKRRTALVYSLAEELMRHTPSAPSPASPESPSA